jgi:hypothetical protein
VEGAGRSSLKALVLVLLFCFVWGRGATGAPSHCKQCHVWSACLREMHAHGRVALGELITMALCRSSSALR